MKKIVARVFLVLSAVVNLQANGQKCTYEFNCNNPQQITRVYCDGQEEIIHLQPGENSRKKIRELRNIDRMYEKALEAASINEAASEAKAFCSFQKNEKNIFTTMEKYFEKEIEEMVDKPIDMNMLTEMARCLGQKLNKLDQKKNS